MFIDRGPHVYQCRSEERKSTSFRPLKFIPLLRTEPLDWGLARYKHLTPSGVKPSESELKPV